MFATSWPSAGCKYVSRISLLNPVRQALVGQVPKFRKRLWLWLRLWPYISWCSICQSADFNVHGLSRISKKAILLLREGMKILEVHGQMQQCHSYTILTGWPPRRVSLAMQAWLPCSLCWLSVPERMMCNVHTKEQVSQNRCETCPHLVHSVLLQHSTPRCRTVNFNIQSLCQISTQMYGQKSCSSVERHKMPWYQYDIAAQ